MEKCSKEESLSDESNVKTLLSLLKINIINNLTTSLSLISTGSENVECGTKSSYSGDHLANEGSPKLCNCWDSNLCHLGGSCLIKNMIYNCLVKPDGLIDRFYVGTTINFKGRYRSYLCCFADYRYSNSTIQTSYV